MVLARNNQKNTKNQKHKHTTAMGKYRNTPNKASQTVTTYHPRGGKRHENNKQGGNGDDEMSEEEENPRQSFKQTQVGAALSYQALA